MTLFRCWDSDSQFCERQITSTDAETAAADYLEEVDSRSGESFTEEAFVWVVPAGEPESAAQLFLTGGTLMVRYSATEAHLHACYGCQQESGCTCRHGATGPRECERCASIRRARAHIAKATAGVKP